MVPNSPPSRRALLVSAGLVLAAACVGVAGWFLYDERREAGVSPRAAPGSPTAVSPAGAGREGMPPLPYRYAGTSVQGGTTWYLLEKDGQVLTVGPGTIVDRDYRVDVNEARELALIYLPTGARQLVPMNEAPWPPQAGGSVVVPQVAKSPIPSAVNRTTSPALQELAR